MLVMHIKRFLCVITFAAYMYELSLSFFYIVALNGRPYSIDMMVTVC